MYYKIPNNLSLTSQTYIFAALGSPAPGLGYAAYWSACSDPDRLAGLHILAGLFSSPVVPVRRKWASLG